MAISIAPLHADFFAEVTGVDLKQPLDDDAFRAIRDAFHRYAVLLFPDQPLTDEEQIALPSTSARWSAR